MRSGSSALSPYWPNARSFALVARPWMRPLCALRNLVRIGCSIADVSSQSLSLGCIPARTGGIAFGHLLVLGHRVVLHDLALEDPDLDAAGAVGGERGSDAVIDVGAAEPAGAVDADAAGAEPHRRLHGALHGAAERDAALELLRDRFGD